MLPGRFVGFTASDPLCLPFDCPVALLLLSSYICTLVLRYEGTYIHTWYLMNVGVYPGTLVLGTLVVHVVHIGIVHMHVLA